MIVIYDQVRVNGWNSYEYLGQHWVLKLALYSIVYFYLISVSLWLHKSAGSNTTALPTN